MSLLRGRRYNRTKKAVPNAKGSNQHSEVNHQNDGQPTTAERLAQQHGDAWADYEKAKAKERQQVRKGEQYGSSDKGGNISTLEVAKSRDAIGARVGVSGLKQVASLTPVEADSGGF